MNNKNNTKKIKKTLNEEIHSINNLLSVISFSAELLLNQSFGDINSEQKKRLKIIISETKKISRILDKF